MPRLRKLSNIRGELKEHDLQALVFDWVRIKRLSDIRFTVIFAVPNSGKRSPGARHYYYKEGLEAGVPDILVGWSNGRYTGLAIEMKRPGEKCTDKQLEVQANFRSNGWRVEVCYSAESAIALIEEYFGIRKPSSELSGPAPSL